MAIKSFIEKICVNLGLKFTKVKSCCKVHLGSDYGGWTICPKGINSRSIIYSFGIGEDVTFDTAIIKWFNCDVFAFDPTPKSIDWVSYLKLSGKFKFYDYGIGANDCLTKFYPPENPNHVSHSILKNENSDPIVVQLFRLDSIIKKLGHNEIDILKLDIEGAEYEVIEDIVGCPEMKINQLLVEFHHFFPTIPYKRTKQAIKKLKKSGFTLFNISESGYEYSFIKDYY